MSAPVLVEGLAVLTAFIRRHSFATLVSGTGDSVLVSHLPLLLDTSGDRLRLLGHVRRGDPHASGMHDRDVLALFLGPSAYVPSVVYAAPPLVPTWSYAVVHVHGRASAINGRAAIEEVLTAVVQHLEPAYADHWGRVTAEYGEVFLDRIVAIDIDVHRVVGYFQLSQDRSAAERDRIAASLSRGPSGAVGVAQLMRELAGVSS